jgi:hypothetical protein
MENHSGEALVPATQLAVPDKGPGHSDIFDRLGANGKHPDLVALVAYGLYQRRKRAWMEKFRNDHNGCHPTEKERMGFALGFQDEMIGALRRDAEGYLASFAATIADQRTEEFKLNALDFRAREALTGINDKLTKLDTYKHHIFGHLFGFATLIIIVALVALGIKYEPSLEKFWHWLSQQT